MALDIDHVWHELGPEHIKSWCRLGMLLGSLVGRNQVIAWVELEIPIEIRVHLEEKERVVQRQLPRPQAPF